MGIPHGKKCRAFARHLWKPFSSATVIYTAWTLVLAARTGSSIVGTELSVLGRALDFPNVDRIVVSLNGRCALLFKFSPSASLSMTMMEL